MSWKPGKKPGTQFCHHPEFGPMVTETECKTLRSLALGVTVPYTHEGWRKLSSLLTMKNLRNLNERVANEGTLSADGGQFSTAEGWVVTIHNHNPNKFLFPGLEEKLRKCWKAGSEKLENGQAKIEPFAMYLEIPGYKGYLSPEEMFSRLGELTIQPSKYGISAVIKGDVTWKSYRKMSIDGDWEFEHEFVPNPPPKNRSFEPHTKYDGCDMESRYHE